MTTERYVRMAAGAFVLASLALGYWIHPRWFLFTACVGLNLFQSAFTRFWPLESILRRCGVPFAGNGKGGCGNSTDEKDIYLMPGRRGRSACFVCMPALLLCRNA